MIELELYEYLKAHNIGTIEELAIALDVSNATARRKLNSLASAGLIEMQRGGVIKYISELELSVDDIFKQKTISLDHQLSARIAASLINDGDIIFIDNGTTVREILKHLEGKQVKIYTNGIYHMINNRNISLDINIIPGELLIKEASIVGAEAIAYLSGLHIDKCFIGINGFDDQGVYTPHRREMLVKNFILRHAAAGYIVATEKKRGLKSKYKVCEANEYPIITERTI